MIITCKKCQNRYFIEPGVIGEKGRKVRCISCAHTWFQDSLEDTEKPKLQSDIHTTRNKDNGTSKTPLRNLGRTVFALGLVISLFIFGKNHIVSVVPRLKPVYQTLGLIPPFLPGLSLEKVVPLSLEKDNKNMVVIKGDIVNRSTMIRAVPTIHIQARGRCEALSHWRRLWSKWVVGRHLQDDECVMSQWTYRLSQDRIFPGEKIHFESPPHVTKVQTTSVGVKF